MEKQSDWFGDVFKIALGVALGVVILWRVTLLYLNYEGQQAVQEIQAHAEVMALKLKDQQHQRDAAELDKRLSDQKIQQAQFSAQLQAADVERRKDEAWKGFYHPAPQCLDSSRSDVSIECGNAYIRAKRQFDATWKP